MTERQPENQPVPTEDTTSEAAQTPEAGVAPTADAAPAAAAAPRRRRSASRAAGPPKKVAESSPSAPDASAPAEEGRAETSTPEPSAAEPAVSEPPAVEPAPRKRPARKRATRPQAAADPAPAPVETPADVSATPEPTVEAADASAAVTAPEASTPQQTDDETVDELADAPEADAPSESASSGIPNPFADAPAAAVEPQRRGRRRPARSIVDPFAQPEPSEPSPEGSEEAEESAEVDEPTGRRSRSRRGRGRGQASTGEDTQTGEEGQPAQDAEAGPAQRDQRAGEPAETEDAAESDEDAADGDGDSVGEGGGRRRRRRGGRRRRRSGEDSDAEAVNDGESADDQQDSERTDPEDENDESEDDGDAQASGNRRRRRRRRRRGEEDASGSDDDPDEVVVRVREPRRRKRASDEVTGIDGSTRMEAKRQRRKEGRQASRRRSPILSEAEFLVRRESVDRKMVIRQNSELTQIAVLEDDVLVEHYVDRDSAASLIGNVYLGRVQNVLPSMEAAFIDIGRGRNAVLYAGEVDWDSFGATGQGRQVEKVLKSGQAVLVQVTKDPVGAKGARLTNHVSLPGRYIVYSPAGHLSGISRKLPENERKRLKDILAELVGEKASVIVRTAAEGASEDELVRDVNRLQAQWEVIEKKVKAGQAPQLLYGEPDLTVRIVRDLFTEDFSELIIAGNGEQNDAYETVDGYVGHVAPHLRERISRWDVTKGDVFAAHRLDEQIAKALERKVFLPSGGSLVIDRTEAMTVIDVNTGKFTGSGGNLEATVTSNNLEAAEEVVRQLRLRDIGGIIVIDFIDMVLPSNRELLLRRLIESLGRDRTRHQVAEVTSLGLVQMTRKKIGTGLAEAFTDPCEACNGRGYHIHDMPVDNQAQADGGERGSRGGGNGGGGNSGGGNGGGGRRGRRGGKDRHDAGDSGRSRDGSGEQQSETKSSEQAEGREPLPAEGGAQGPGDREAPSAAAEVQSVSRPAAEPGDSGASEADASVATGGGPAES